MATVLYRIYAFETAAPDFTSDDCSVVQDYSDWAEAWLYFGYWKSQSKVGGMLVCLAWPAETIIEVLETWNAPADGPDDGP